MESEQTPINDSAVPVDPPQTGEHSIKLVIKPQSSVGVTLTLEPGSEVEVTVQSLDEHGQSVQVKRLFQSNPLPFEPLPKLEIKAPRFSWRFPSRLSLQTWLIIAALAVYLVSRFIGLDSFPLYFFTDEAIQTIHAQDLINNGLKAGGDEVLPTFFVNGGQYNLGVSVYAQVIPWLMFGKSIWVTRGTSVLINLLAALAIGLMMKNIQKSRYPFVGILLLSITPAWFLHSRTAFEVVIAVAFYAVFLYAYLMYRQGSPKYFYAAVVAGALCFYSYSPAQLVMLVTAVGLLISDFRTHLKNWKVVLIGLGIGVILAVPYFRFMILHPNENRHHLEVLDSYWIQSIPLKQKMGYYFKEYFKLLNPLYWFAPNDLDIVRHLMKNYAHLVRWSLPVFVLGLFLALKRIKQPQYRAFLIALLAAPSGAALAQAAITRSLFMVVPVVILTAIGFDQIFHWLERLRISRLILAIAAFISLAGVNGYMVWDALTNGPTWFEDYALSGQQYGGKQVFGEISTILRKNPDQKIYMSPDWANGTDVVARFFLDDPLPIVMGSMDSYLFDKQEFNKDQIFIVIPNEMDKIKESGKFIVTEEVKVLPYPNGKPGFYFVKLRYVDNIDEILAEERAIRNQLKEAVIMPASGNSFTVKYPELDNGTIENLFDGDDRSLARTYQANPMPLEIIWEVPQLIQEVDIHIGGTATTINMDIIASDGTTTSFEKIEKETNDYRTVAFPLDQPVLVKSMLIKVLNTLDGVPAHVHVWEIEFK